MFLLTSTTNSVCCIVIFLKPRCALTYPHAGCWLTSRTVYSAVTSCSTQCSSFCLLWALSSMAGMPPEPAQHSCHEGKTPKIDVPADFPLCLKRGCPGLKTSGDDYHRHSHLFTTSKATSIFFSQLFWHGYLNKAEVATLIRQKCLPFCPPAYCMTCNTIKSAVQV